MAGSGFRKRLELLLDLSLALQEMIPGSTVQALTVLVTLVQQVVDDLEVSFELLVP